MKIWGTVFFWKYLLIWYHCDSASVLWHLRTSASNRSWCFVRCKSLRYKSRKGQLSTVYTWGFHQVLSLPCWLSLRTTSILVRAFWNFKLKVLQYSRNCSLHNTLICTLKSKNRLNHLMYILLRCFAACPRAKVFMGAYKGRIQMAGQSRAAKSRLPEWPLIPCSVSSLKSARNTCGVIRVLGQLSGLDICSQFKKLTVFNFVSTYVP